MSEPPEMQIEATANFQKNLRALAKRYRSIRKDIQPVLDQLAAGQMVGDLVTGVGDAVYKVRVPNRDSQRGKRGGYRLLYYLRTETAVVLVTIYSKSEQSDVAISTIQELIAQYQPPDTLSE
ncbi:MAG: type II toxin-antitoxin system RelE/ParE family toxin [Prochlorothrix sp.]